MAVRTFLEGGVLEIVLDRPERANALTLEMIGQLHEAFERAARGDGARSVLVRGEGEHFCAGADVAWMRAAADAPEERNREEALLLAETLRVAWLTPKPVVAAVHGACYGGGAGLCCVADACVADDTAKVRFSEVRLGLEPSTISPYVVRAVGPRAARRLFVTGAEAGADEALRIGLFSAVVGTGEAVAVARRLCEQCAENGPGAMAAAKELVGLVDRRPVGRELSEFTADRLAAIRSTDEGREGADAFLGKRPPAWARDR